MNILLTGAGGLMGNHLAEEMTRRGIQFHASTRNQLDICDIRGSIAALDSIRPDVVINAAALCNFDACQSDPETSEKINLHAPMWWAQECTTRNIRFVHFSSDYIFDGNARTPYLEDAKAGPLCVYGGHKAETELALRELPHALTLRVAWLFGKQGKTFMSMLPDLLMNKPELTIAAGKKGSCLYAASGARAVIDLILRKASGVVNLIHRGETSWEEFASHALNSLHERGCLPKCTQIKLIPFQEMLGNSGQRPDYSVLDPSRAERLLSHPLPHWTEGLEAYLDALGFPPLPARE